MVAGTWQGGKTFAISLPGSPALTVHADGPRSTDLLLAGLIACSGRNFCDILAKMRLAVERIEIAVEADRQEEEPHAFTEIRVVWRIACGSAPKARVERALDLTEAYCTVLHILKKAARVQSVRMLS